MPVSPAVGGLRCWAAAAEVFGGHRSGAYETVARACAADPYFDGLGPPLVLLHAVRLAALQGRARDPWSGDADAFRHDARALDDEVAAAVRRGLVQFTEPLRMADLLPGFFFAAARYPGRPLRLVDLGACAGLHLVPECYEVRYPGTAWSPPGAVLKLDCALDVPARLLERELLIADRVGIDLAPVDPAAPGTATYLRSFAWAGDPARERRLEAALVAVAARAPEIREGGIPALLPGMLAERVSRDAVTVVVDSGTSTYLSSRECLGLGRLLDRMAGHGPLVLVARGGAEPVAEGFPSVVRVVDLSRPWRAVYAAADLLSERMQWTGRAGDLRAGGWP